MQRMLILGASIFGFSGVALGAFAAHGLKHVLLAGQLATFQTAVQYQMLHALALLALAALPAYLSPRWVKAAGIFWMFGIVLFSGSLYVLSLTQVRVFGMLTPVGGVAFLMGWACLAITAWRCAKRK